MANGGYGTPCIERYILISEVLKDKGYVSQMDKTQYYAPDIILAANLLVWGTRHVYDFIS